MRSTTDPYLILRPSRMVRDAPKELLPYLEIVRKASEWLKLGFKVELNDFGRPVRVKKSDFYFSSVRENDEVIVDAIKTGKKALRHPLPVFEYFQVRCSLSEFANLPKDVEEYCLGNSLRLEGKLQEALSHLHQAVTLNPQQVRYFEVYFPLRISLGDLSAISEELLHYKNDMDSAVHSGRFDDWMKTLIKAEEFELVRVTISATESALQDLVNDRVSARLYGKQKNTWYENKLTQFYKKSEKYLMKIEKLENKKKISKAQKSKSIKRAVTASDVGTVIFNFTQRCFIGEGDQGQVDLSHENSLFHRLKAGPISQVEAHQLPPGQRQVLRELLTQYIMFLEMNKKLEFPTGFLDDSNQDSLGTNLLGYICHYKWPFPQMLNR